MILGKCQKSSPLTRPLSLNCEQNIQLDSIITLWLGVEIIDEEHLGLLESRLQQGGRLRRLGGRPAGQGPLRVVGHNVKLIGAEQEEKTMRPSREYGTLPNNYSRASTAVGTFC